MNRDREVDFGDEVRIVASSDTEERGYAGKTGTCLGITTPSVTGVEVVGEIDGDRALNVSFDDPGVSDAWFSTRLVEFVSHTEGTIATSGATSFKREADGSWSQQ